MSAVEFPIEPIGVIHTEFKEKFGIPRQPGLATFSRGVIELFSHKISNSLFEQACKQLYEFSHIWVIFIFHKHNSKGFKASIRPPRLGGKKKVGAFGTRSPHRPNPIGLSAVKLEKISKNKKGRVIIEVSGLDILDGSPVLDIKPYLPYADSIPTANAGWTNNSVEIFPVSFTEKALGEIEKREKKYPKFKERIIEMLEIDPRPASQKVKYTPKNKENEGKKFGFILLDYDIKWEITDSGFRVYDIEDLINGKIQSKSK
ncbi:MAG: tRNA (N6-threonylcarbamoyladenosine(37)-N6)-methyltransferase TrmO [Xanthomonadaceae bacterium]|nr:tRNA (N6-threonylcarbamoyladenosine(37)-N6)-methyltransferase TrmO [Xanthomonadaceae bacterium]